MAVNRITAADAAAALEQFDSVIDARSESEFAIDHLPGAVKWPTLNDEERHTVGTEYKQISAFDARKRGAVLAARNIAAHLEREAAQLPRRWKPLVYCWRGGQRSGALAMVLGQVGFEVTVLEGGYREFRRMVMAALEVLPATLTFKVLCGKTGSGKSRLLGALAAAGAQVLDLEGLACHRGSVLGSLPGEPQPSQKRFESALWDALRHFDPGREIFVESESRTVGRLRVPESLLSQMRASPCVVLEMPAAARVELLMQDYAHFADEPEALCERLAVLREARGEAVVERWQAMARSGQIEGLVLALLNEHYDPIYLRSMARNFGDFEAAPRIIAHNGSAAELARLAGQLVGVAGMQGRA